MNTKGKLLLGALLIIAIVSAGYFYLTYLDTGRKLPLASAAAQVSIGKPANGASLVAFEPLSVDALAVGPAPFLSMELWINGELASIQAGPADGKTPLSSSFAWLPQEEGTFSLVARAVDAQGQTSTSDPVQVVVGPNQDLANGLTEQFAGVPAVQPALSGGGYTPPAGPSSNETSGLGEDWDGGLDDWINSLSNDTPPAAPELVIQTDAASCSANLLIHDLSDNEEGFALYLQINNSNWVQFTTLNAQSQNDWIEKPILHLAGGQNSFYVSAFNAQGEAQSNLVTAYMDPADCLLELVPMQTNEFEIIHLQELHFSIGVSPDKLYCYRSLNGGTMTKWPASGYFYPDSDGAFSLDEILQVVTSQTEGQGFSLYLECWGWYGDLLKYLGSVSTDNTLTIIGNEAFELVFEKLDADLEIVKYGNSDDLVANLQIGAINDLILKNMFPPDMVSPAAYVTYDPQECTNHLPPSAQNLFGTILFCFPYEGFHGGFAEGDNPQPYLVWNFYKSCGLGYGTEQQGGPCHSYDYWRQLASDNNGTVGFYVYDYSSEGNHTWTVQTDQLRMLNIPPNGCNGSRTFYVQMWYEEQGFKQLSQWSNPYTIDCPKPVGDVLTLDFTFETLKLANQDDGEGDFGPHTVELYGYFQVEAPSSQLGNNNFLKMGAWDEQWSECPDDTGAFTGNVPGSCTQRLSGGATHSLFNIPLCKSSDYTQASKHDCWRHFANSSTQDLYTAPNNTLRVEVTDGDAIRVWVILHDWDDASANDLACWGFAEFQSKSIFEWHAMDGAGFSVAAFGDASSGGTCTISGSIHVND